jgi:hypothetical protein
MTLWQKDAVNEYFVHTEVDITGIFIADRAPLPIVEAHDAISATVDNGDRERVSTIHTNVATTLLQHKLYNELIEFQQERIIFLTHLLLFAAKGVGGDYSQNREMVSQTTAMSKYAVDCEAKFNDDWNEGQRILDLATELQTASYEALFKRQSIKLYVLEAFLEVFSASKDIKDINFSVPPYFFVLYHIAKESRDRIMVKQAVRTVTKVIEREKQAEFAEIVKDQEDKITSRRSSIVQAQVHG